MGFLNRFLKVVFKMALIEERVVKSQIPYEFTLPTDCLQKNLSKIFFEERQTLTF